jgi:hypothetical protein
MAKTKQGRALVVIGVIGLAGLGIFLYSRKAKAAEGAKPLPGKTEGGKLPPKIPRPAKGGKTYGKVPKGQRYELPADWDPLRGLWISPDCEVVVEAPGWYCGLDTVNGKKIPLSFGGNRCNAYEAESYVETMAQEDTGVAGYVLFLINAGMQPEEIAYQILTEVSPFCADVPDSQWPQGLQSWYESFLERVILTWEEEQGIPFE